jgi:iron complex outermembrane receptor protein
LWGRTWDGGDITLSYEWYDDSPIQGSAKGSKWRIDYTPWGLDNRVPLASSLPGTITTSGGVQPAGLGLGTSATMGTNCTNCFAIPRGIGGNFSPINGGLGPTAPFSGSTLNWTNFNVAANTGTNGVRNEFSPFALATFGAAEQRNAAVMTFDQRLTRNISAFGDGFYSNRRAQFRNPSNIGPATTNDLVVAIPTWNPYYPTGGAPNNLRVNYNIGLESPSITSAYEVASRYHVGLNIDLPRDWAAVVYYSMTRDENRSVVRGTVNKNAVSAALGWTMAAGAASGTTPGIATWTRPPTVPYLNMFCDPFAFQCNSPTTLNYVGGIRDASERYFINEKGIRADGPLFALPAGEVKMAVGANLTSSHNSLTRFENTASPSLILPITTDERKRNVWAVFTQVNVPVIGENNALPGIAKLELEGSWRHDQYDDLGSGTSNPKLAFNWTVDQDVGLTIRGAWGNSFRAPGFGELSPLGQAAINVQNAPAFGSTFVMNVLCDAEPGSGAYKLLHPTVGPALNGGACGNIAAAQPVGLTQTGSSTPAVLSGWRNFVNTDQKVLKPETAFNWSIGAEFAPTAFLQGLDVQVTWYKIKLTNVLTGPGNPGTTNFNQGAWGTAFIVPTDLFSVDPACNNNNTPATCPEFQAMILAMMGQPTSAAPVQAQSSINWLGDLTIYNKGWTSLDGIDWSISYDTDLGDFGAWNAGIVGTYYMHRKTVVAPGDPGLAGQAQDQFNTTVATVGGIVQEGVPSPNPRMRYRARLGWAKGGWSTTLFMDYISHYFHTQAAPPNVNFQCVASGGTTPGGTFPCAISNYTNIQPSMYTFDLSVGYDTGDTPTNAYLRNVGIQLVVQNLFDRDPAFQYRISTGGGNPAAFDIQKGYGGRSISLILTKTW